MQKHNAVSQMKFNERVEHFGYNPQNIITKNVLMEDTKTRENHARQAQDIAVIRYQAKHKAQP